MALFSFGRKDKKPPEVPASVAKTQPTPPKIQSPPATGSFPPVKPPQPTGLLAPALTGGGALTTQPMSVPRVAASGLKPARVGTAQSTRSTQRIVLPTPPGARANNTKSLSTAGNGRISLPIGMILRCLPPEVLASDLAEFEVSGAAATEIGLPMNSILGQLPSGKVEMTLQELVPHFPPGYLQPTEAIASYLPNVVSLPLMDVVMRIPPDLLALRPDQKDVDASVINMADPFTEEILREQAEAARRQSQPNIIEESQVPHEEFVPRDQTLALKTVAPPRRPSVEPMSPTRTTATTLGAAPPMPPVSKLPTPPGPGGPRASQSLPRVPATPVRTFATPPESPAEVSSGDPEPSLQTLLPLPRRPLRCLPCRGIRVPFPHRRHLATRPRCRRPDAQVFCLLRRPQVPPRFRFPPAQPPRQRRTRSLRANRTQVPTICNAWPRWPWLSWARANLRYRPRRKRRTRLNHL